jgi:cytochrome P450
MRVVTVDSELDLTDRVEAWFRDVQARQDPFELLADLRAHDPIHWNEPLKTWVVTRFEDVRTILREKPAARGPRYSRDISYVYDANGEVRPAWRLSMGSQRWMEGEDLARVQGILKGAFSPRRVSAWVDGMRVVIEESIDRFRGRSEMEFMHDLAFELPLNTICTVLGISPDMRADIHRWTDQIIEALFPFVADEVRDRGDAAAIALRAYIEELVAKARVEPGEGLLDVIVRARDEHGSLNDDELAGVTFGLLSAGHETVGSTLGNGLIGLLRQRDQWEALCAQPELGGQAFDEALRWQPASQMTMRWAMEDFELGARQIHKQDAIAVFLVSAGRDEAVYAEPDRFIIQRDDRIQHLGFGIGPHFCCGNQLARAEGNIALATLAREFPAMELASDNIEWTSSIVRIPASVPLRWG